MAAPRAVQFIALRNLRPISQIRHLRMTGPATYSSPAALVAEHVHRSPVPASTAASHDFSASSSNISAAPLDFVHLPSALTAEEEGLEDFVKMRVPIAPDCYKPTRTTPIIEEAEVAVMKPEISTSAHGSVYSPVADTHDGHAEGTEFHELADTFVAGVKKMAEPMMERNVGTLGRVWRDMVDDVLGVGKRKATA